MKKAISFLLSFFVITNAYASCTGSPSNAACSQWNADKTNCQLYTSHANQCTWADAYCNGVPDCGSYGADVDACNASPGGICGYGFICDGTIDCSSFSGGEASCDSAGGGGICTWVPGQNYDPDSCVGSPNCSDHAFDSDSCDALPGCTSTSSCNVMFGCGTFSSNPTNCGATPGCSNISSSCSGTMTCAAQTDSTSCGGIGCTPVSSRRIILIN